MTMGNIYPLMWHLVTELSAYNLLLYLVKNKKVAVTGPPPEGMVNCGICGRNFNEDRIAKHETICKKTTTKKRKIFDVTKHRVQVRMGACLVNLFHGFKCAFKMMYNEC